MACLNFCRIRPIGHRMGTKRFLLIAILGTNFGILHGNNLNFQLSNSGWSPLLGFYAKSDQGLVEFFSNNPDIKIGSLIRCISIQDFNGFSCTTSARSKGVNRKAIMPGYMQDMLGNGQIALYSLSCRFEDKAQKKCEIGIVIDENSKIVSLKKYKSINMRNNDKFYDIQIRLSHESIHVKCYDLTNNSMINHFVYYLGYEIDPELVDKDIEKFSRND
jgi:hypothetical protein